MDYAKLIEAVSKGVEVVGITVIVLGAVVATVSFVRSLRREEDADARYTRYRRGLGRSIFLGLEFLVAGDIIRTVGVERTVQVVGVLAGIVLVRPDRKGGVSGKRVDV